MKKGILFLFFFSALLAVFAGLGSCATSPPAQDAPQDELDLAIREASDYINKNVPGGSKLAIVNIRSDYPLLSEYVVDTLMENIVNDRMFTVVDRQQLDAIRAELDFQLSGEVDDDSAQALGRMVGAQTILVGSVTAFGSMYRLTVRALSVEGAQVQGMFNRNIRSGGTIAALISSPQTSAAGGASAIGGRQGNGSSNNAPPPSQPAQPVPDNNPPSNVIAGGTVSAPSQTANVPQPETPAPHQQASSDSPGLYVNGAFQGAMDLMDAVDWIALNAGSGGSYVIVLGKDEAAPYISLSYNNQQVSITLKASGGERMVKYEVNRPSYSLFTVGPGVTFTLEEGVTLTGLRENSQPLVRVTGGTFIMNGGSIRDNRDNRYGGGVHIESGTFTMNNGTISGNSASGGGGVYMEQGTFTMNNGTISGNSAGYNNRGGGVYVYGGTFTMNGGTISGNSSGGSGGGVYVREGTFTKSGSGGIIYGSNAPEGQANKASGTNNGDAVYANDVGRRNTTARVSTAMDSRQRGAAGGWE